MTIDQAVSIDELVSFLQSNGITIKPANGRYLNSIAIQQERMKTFIDVGTVHYSVGDISYGEISVNTPSHGFMDQETSAVFRDRILPEIVRLFHEVKGDYSLPAFKPLVSYQA